MQRRPAPTLLSDHDLTLLQGGDALFPAMVAAIAAARVEVLVETYILHIAGSVVAVAEALEHAAARGVRVRLVFDGVGTGALPQEWATRWDRAGVQWRAFNPARGWRVLLPSRWRRLHRKLCVVDATVAFCGGINLLDDRLDLAYGELAEPRLDFAVRAVGPLVEDVHETMTRLWWRLQFAREARRSNFRRMLIAVRAAAGAGVEKVEVHGSAVAALVLRDNVRFRRRIEVTYRLAITQARQTVLIANAYFLPGVQLQRALLQAARRGVRVTLLLQGRYEYFLSHHASRAVYDRLLLGGIEIVEYDASFLHAKVALMDGPLGDVATVGSSNLDPLSLLLAREANVWVRDAAFVAQLSEQLHNAIVHHGRRIEPSVHRKRPWLARSLNWLAYGLMRLALLANRRRY